MLADDVKSDSSDSELGLIDEAVAVQRRRVAIGILVVCVALLPIAGYLALKFFGNTQMMYGAPKGTMVFDTEMMAETVFRTQVFHNPLFMLVSSKTNVSVLTAGGNELCELTELLQSFVGVIPDMTHVTGYCVYKSSILAFGFVNKALTSSFIAADFLLGSSLESTKGVQNDLIRRVNDALDVNFTHLSVKYSSVGLVSQDLEHGLVKDLMLIDAVSIPLAVLALAICLRSVRMLLLPAITIPVTLCFAFAICYPVTLLTEVSSFAPEMASATTLAISIDYSLFILSRFNELAPKYELLGGGPSAAVQYKVCADVALLSSHNIVVSGLTIAVALGGLVLMPVKFIGTIGYVFFFCSITAVVVSLIVMPSILFIFYGFFRQPADLTAPFKWIKRKCEAEAARHPTSHTNDSIPPRCDSAVEVATQQRLVYSDAEGDLRGVDPFSPGTQEFFDDMRTDQYLSMWFRIGSFANSHPWIVICLVFAFGAPFMWQCSQIEVNFDLFEQVPRDSPHGATLKNIMEDVGNLAVPFYITIDTGLPGGILNEAVFGMVQNLTRHVAEQTGTSLLQYTSFAMLPDGIPIEFSNLTWWKSVSLYDEVWRLTVDPTNRAGMIQLIPTFDPFNSEANSFLNKLDSALTDFRSSSNATIGLMGASSASWAIMKKVMELFPLQIGITFAVIFAFIALVFRSVFVPVRMLLTVGYTVSVSLGMGVVFFQYSWSHNIWTSMKGVNSYSWTVPIFAFSLLCALALDYDVFLLTRMVEMRKHGYEPNAAIVKAVYKTGRIISFAGVIMAISFGGMVFGAITMLNQFGFISAFAVLLDTFVIRSLLVPAIMSIAPSAIWFPRKFEREDRGVDDMTG